MFWLVLFLAEKRHRLDYWRVWRIANVADFMCQCWLLAKRLEPRKRMAVRNKIERFMFSAFIASGRLLNPRSWTIRVPGSGKRHRMYAARTCILRLAYGLLTRWQFPSVASFLKAKTRLVFVRPCKFSDLFTGHGREARCFSLEAIECFRRAEKSRANRRERVQWPPYNFGFCMGDDPDGFTEQMKFEIQKYMPTAALLIQRVVQPSKPWVSFQTFGRMRVYVGTTSSLQKA